MSRPVDMDPENFGSGGHVLGYELGEIEKITIHLKDEPGTPPARRKGRGQTACWAVLFAWQAALLWIGGLHNPGVLRYLCLGAGIAGAASAAFLWKYWKEMTGAP
jgi:hypothetical protein